MSTRSEMLLQDLSKAINIPDLKFDEQRMCSLMIDDSYHITLLANSEEFIFLYGVLGGLPENGPEDFALELLTANMLFAEASGPYIGYEPVSNAILLAMSVPLDGLDVHGLEAKIEYMVQSQEKMRLILKEKDIRLTEVLEEGK